MKDFILDNSKKALDTFLCLVANGLIEPRRGDFDEIVREIYYMTLEEGEDFIPSQYSLSDTIDEENYSVIHIYLEDRGELYLESDILSLYEEIISQELPYKTMEALEHLGLPYRKCNIVNNFNWDAQTKLFEWEEIFK